MVLEVGSRPSAVLRLFGKTITLPIENSSINLVSLEKEVVNNECDVAFVAGDDEEEDDNNNNNENSSSFSGDKRKMDDHEGLVSAGSPVKKPDKILPCPRCECWDTKFCYYNNYNLNQPRHFCKGCQRYWTAGGTMRNVPVGSGRRKSKSFDMGSFLPRLKQDGSSSLAEKNAENTYRKHSNNPTSSSSSLVFQQPWNFQIPHPTTSPSTTTTSTVPKSVEEHNERCLWIPEALRIDNPEEAARSSVWTTLGVTSKRENKRLKINGGLFGSFNQKTTTDDNNNEGHVNGFVNRVLQANPAALARSINFQETI